MTLMETRWPGEWICHGDDGSAKVVQIKGTYTFVPKGRKKVRGVLIAASRTGGESYVNVLSGDVIRCFRVSRLRNIEDAFTAPEKKEEKKDDGRMGDDS